MPKRDPRIDQMAAQFGVSPDAIDGLLHNMPTKPVVIPVEVHLPTRHELGKAAAQVLWALDGDHELGEDGGSFTDSIIIALCRADKINEAKLAMHYPALVAVVGIYKTHPEGLNALRLMARDYKTLPATGGE